MTEEASALSASKPAIVWGLPPTDSATPKGVLDEERDKHRRRAERFGADYVEPGKVRKELALEAKRERLSRPAFVTGFDPFSQAELEKRRNRAARFNIPDAPEPQYQPPDEVAAKARRAQKFGIEYDPQSSVLMDMDLFETRREVGMDVERRRDTIHLYGVDVMSTDDVYKYFEEYGPTFVEWINDSSCNVVFGDEASCKRAMVGTGQPLPPAEGTPTAGIDPSDMGNLPYLWHQGRDFVKGGTPIHLVYRMAVTDDVRRPDQPKASRELWKTGRVGGKSKRRDWGEGQRRRGAGAGAEEEQGAEVGEDGDVEMRSARKKQRGGRKARERAARRGGAGQGDVEMEDADWGMHDDREAIVEQIEARLRGSGQGEEQVPAHPVDMGPPVSMLQPQAPASAGDAPAG